MLIAPRDLQFYFLVSGKKNDESKMKTVLLSTAALFAVAIAAPVVAGNADKKAGVDPNTLATKYPIKHLVVIFNENISFDHYFGTYPNVLEIEGKSPFKAAKGTQTDINNYILHGSLLIKNPNALNTANGVGAANPFRLDRTQAATADQGHAYTPEQLAYDAGKNDAFPVNTGNGTSGGAGAFGTKGQVMGYFDGATVTALWNYAQNYAMSDNAWSDDFGPSTPGAVNMFAGTRNGAVIPAGKTASTIPDGAGGLTLINDTDPAGDVCSNATAQVQMTSKNIGDLLNAANIPWGSVYGWFQPANRSQQRHQRLRTHVRKRGDRRDNGRLYPASRLVPVLRVDSQPDPCSPELDQVDRLHDDPGQEQG